ncbi:ABC transporter permease [Saccharothrix syringae]|uniref:Transport permease protein n=1 Tax=Saccharothrix syringae TaxID=103733 RepID=A0A5Q0H2C8_SACSY|nr:ABC transporter permease [Saccharothrix syringae]QFZ20407.1 ABC transporter permease [Saccharothrix syringae]
MIGNAVDKGAVTLRAGLDRAWIEFRQTVTSVAELFAWLWIPLAALLVMYFVGDDPVPGTGVTLGAQAIPGILGMNVVFTALLGLAMALTADREDGTLLRAKATPHGMSAYLMGKVLSKAGMTVATMVILLIPTTFLFDGLQMDRVSPWADLVLVLLLGLVATLPIGAVLGSLFSNVQTLGFITLFLMALVAISGVFYPITALPEWLQFVGQVFPVYWLGLGLRSALLPDDLALAEVGGTWREWEMVGVLGLWAVIGFVLAPVVLRRMARRESGSAVAARREQLMQRAA